MKGRLHSPQFSRVRVREAMPRGSLEPQGQTRYNYSGYVTKVFLGCSI